MKRKKNVFEWISARPWCTRPQVNLNFYLLRFFKRFYLLRVAFYHNLHWNILWKVEVDYINNNRSVKKALLDPKIDSRASSFENKSFQLFTTQYKGKFSLHRNLRILYLLLLLYCLPRLFRYKQHSLRDKFPRVVLAIFTIEPYSLDLWHLKDKGETTQKPLRFDRYIRF